MSTTQGVKLFAIRDWRVAPLVLLLTVLLTSCGGSPSQKPSPPPPPPPTITSVTISSDVSALRTGQQFRFPLLVEGTGNFNASVTWSVNGIPSGDAINGTISASGTYTAPAVPPPTNPVTITATSVEDPTKSGSANLSIFTIAISPASATVFYNHTQQFAATVTGIANPGLVWFATYGSVDANGLYTPPLIISQNASDTVSVNVANAGSASVAAAITLQIPPPVLTSIAPDGASANEPVAINGNDLYGPTQILFPGPNGSTLSPDFQAVSLTQITTTVPLGAVSGPVYIQSAPTTGVTDTSNSIAFARLPNLRIRAGTRDLSSGESIQFAYRLLGASNPRTVNWTADVGSVNSTGLYQAPAVTRESFAKVTACVATTRSCDSTILRILPLRIEPQAPIVALGQTLQLDAVQGSQTPASWSVLAGGGSFTSSGLFTAPTIPLQAGGVPISATAGSDKARAPIAVTGAFPGLVSRTYDYMNFTFSKQVLEGTLVRTLAVNGNRAYAVDDGVRFTAPFNGNPPFSALEVYDISDPTNPIWLDATESMSSTPYLLSSYGHYVFSVDVTTTNNQPGRVALYDVQSSPPKLLSYVVGPDLDFPFDNNGIIYALPFPAEAATLPPGRVYMFDVRSGTIIQNQVDLPLPSDANAGMPPFQAVGNGNTIYALFGTASGSTLATYDISVSPPNLVASTPVTGPSISIPSMLIRGTLLFVNRMVVDISNLIPAQLSILPIQNVEDVRGNLVLGRGDQYLYDTPDNYSLVDITDPANPVVKSDVYDFADLPGLRPRAQFAGGSEFIAVDGLGGLATWDFSAAGGQFDKSRTVAFPSGFVFDQSIAGQTMYVAGASGLGAGGLETFDLGSGTPVQSGQLLYTGKEGFALQVAGTNLFLGLTDSLKTVNISSPANPVESASQALPTSALALSGNTLFVGTGDNRLVVLNVTNPNSPVTLASLTMAGPAVTMRVAGSLLFVADGPQGLLVFDVSNPANPVQLSQFTLTTPIWDVAVAGSSALLAADSSGLVIVDVSNPSQIKQRSQTTLESYNPFPYQFDTGPRSVALAVAIQNGIAYVGTANSAGLVFGFDYSQPANPRLVSMSAYGEFIDTSISGFSFSGNDIYVAGALGADTGIVQADNSAPRNAINLYYPPQALRSNTFAARVARQSAKLPRHPKFDRSMWPGLSSRKHRRKSGNHELLLPLSVARPSRIVVNR
jgi:hypothetical protein